MKAKNKKLAQEYENLTKSLMAQKDLVENKYKELEKYKDTSNIDTTNYKIEIEKINEEKKKIQKQLDFAKTAKDTADKRSQKAKSELESLKDKHEQYEKKISELEGKIEKKDKYLKDERRDLERA